MTSTTGPHTAWTPNQQLRANVDRLQAWGLLWVALLGIGMAAAFVLVPAEPNWRHYLAASVLGFKSCVLLRIASKLINIVIKGKGRRRFR